MNTKSKPIKANNREFDHDVVCVKGTASSAESLWLKAASNRIYDIHYNVHGDVMFGKSMLKR